ncbi:Methionine aminopeptidase 2 [Tritrichomonas foetus]|uniref:Methionine aminopeptidase 2 n=1 Tax=Tritrichomonas foetus TaxID=1144522 RepID=A0A1J4KMC6_9EUKA|nr:Methionine aminopeptidase 2 [Tritrichomonas foetus]|eukprot:OHT12463.1 Methionine aminopeptidase 2 [Tritrichomonas foetus]
MVGEDDFEFLLAAAAKNKAMKEETQKKNIYNDDIFLDLPPTPASEYPDGKFPVRDIIHYTKLPNNEYSGFRPKDQEQTERLEALKEALPYLREGGIVHQKVREWSICQTGPIKVGANLWEMCGQIEEAVRREVGFSPPRRGLGFPCGCSINHEAAHYSPCNINDTRVLGKSDVMKIDFGVAIEGHVIDSAFTVCFDDRFKPLIDASKEATTKAIRACGPDARISEISGLIEEIISGYQMELDGKILPIQPIKTLSGHGLAPYKVHAGKQIPCVKTRPGYETYDEKMEIGEYYALETFATTGLGITYSRGATSHYMINPKAPKAKNGSLRDLEDCIMKNFKTLAFCQRFIERAGKTNFQNTLDKLVHQKIVNAYPPLCDVEGSYVSQHEHCFGIFEKGLEVFSRDVDLPI